MIPLDSHIRLANPARAQTANQRLIRRSYNYDLGMDENGNLQAGHIFIAYQQDVERQFMTVQKRLIGEPLSTTCSRSAAATSSPSPASATPATGTAGAMLGLTPPPAGG